MISNNSIARVDPYAIREMQFNIKRSKKHTTIKSLVATLVVLLLTIGISFRSLEHIWISRADLPINLIKKDTTPNDPMSETPVCIINNDTTSTRIPRILGLDIENNTIPLIDRNLVPTKYPYMLPYLNTTYYECLDLTGLRTQLRGTTLRSIVISSDIPATAFIKMISREEIIDGADPIVLSIGMTNVGVFQLFAKMEKYVLKDRLAIDYEPEVFTGMTTIDYGKRVSGISANLVHLGYPIEIADIKNILSARNSLQYTITRESIGQILGKFFAWYGLFLLIFIVIFQPIVEFSFNVQLVKTIYTHDLLNPIQPSIITHFKFYMAYLCARFVPERIIHVAFQRLDQDMDIINLLRKQLMMRRISKELRYSETQVELFVPDFQQDADQDKDLLQKDQDSDQSSDQETTAGDRNHSDFEVASEENYQFFLLRWIDGFFSGLDYSEVEIGLVYNKGNPHGSLWSIIVTLLGVGGLLAFLLLTGVLSIQTDTVFSSVVADRDTGANKTYTMMPQDILWDIRAVLPGLTIPIMEWDSLNSTLHVVQNLTIKSGVADCNATILALNVTSLAGTPYCLNQSFTFYNNAKGQFNMLRETFREGNPFFPIYLPPTQKIYAKQVRYVNDSYNFITSAISSSISDQMSIFNMELFEYDDQVKNVTDDGVIFIGSVSTEINRFTQGNAYKLRALSAKIEIQSSTIWDILDNTWGMVVLTFEIIILKLGKVINRSIKNSSSHNQRENQRGNIVNILANHDRLIHGSFRNELNGVKYYFKENLSMSQIRA